MTRGRLDNAIQFIAEGEGPNAPRLLTFGELKHALRLLRRKGAKVEDLWCICQRPLRLHASYAARVWRLLAIQAALYDGMHRLGFRLGSSINMDDVADSLTLSPELRKQFDVESAESVESVARVVDSYIGQHVAPTLKRIG